MAAKWILPGFHDDDDDDDDEEDDDHINDNH